MHQPPRPCVSAPHLSVLRYTNTGQSAPSPCCRRTFPAGGPADRLARPDEGFQTAVGDFDGQGADQLAFSFVAQDASPGRPRLRL